MEKIVSLAKRRGFIFPGSEIYGGLANSWDYGPLGVELKNNIKQEWWKRFVKQRSDMVGIDAALIMNPKVWEASGHLKNFSDPLVECKKCHSRFRADQIGFPVPTRENPITEVFTPPSCPTCNTRDQWTVPKQFNLMLRTFLGSADPVDQLARIYFKSEWSNVEEIEKKPSQEEIIEDAKKAFEEIDKATVYFRPETAQAMFVDFKTVLDTARKKIPFGIAQVGKAFRNEITPGNFIFRTREFEQMEIEYFVKESDWEKHFDNWLNEMKAWLKDLGVRDEKLHFVEIPDGERAHYSKRTVDIEYEYPFGQKELYGLAYRGDFDLQSHQKASGQELVYIDPATNEKFIPHVIEPTWGVDRSVLVAMLEAYHEESAPTAEEGENETRVVMKFPKWLAPVKVAVLPLSKKEQLSSFAKEIHESLLKDFTAEYDETQSIGKRYRRQDEIGTPYCVTVDFDSLEDKKVTVRDRDTMQQERIEISELAEYLRKKLSE